MIKINGPKCPQGSGDCHLFAYLFFGNGTGNGIYPWFYSHYGSGIGNGYNFDFGF